MRRKTSPWIASAASAEIVSDAPSSGTGSNTDSRAMPAPAQAIEGGRIANRIAVNRHLSDAKDFAEPQRMLFNGELKRLSCRRNGAGSSLDERHSELRLGHRRQCFDAQPALPF